MNQGQIQEQKLEQKLAQSFSQQQLLQAQLVELPITQLLERINTEMNDNPALEADADRADFLESPEPSEGLDSTDEDDDFDSQREREDRQSALDAALESIGRDDEELPVYQGGSSVGEEREEYILGDTVSFYDQLKEQMGLANLTERERDIMEYLIGSLDDDGLLRKPLDAISDELAVYHNIDVTAKEVERVLLKLQAFDPAGIGARSLQECLQLQIERARAEAQRHAGQGSLRRTSETESQAGSLDGRGCRPQYAADNPRLHHRHTGRRHRHLHAESGRTARAESLAVVCRLHEGISAKQGPSEPSDQGGTAIY